MKRLKDNSGKFDRIVTPILEAARIPGAAVAVVAYGKTIYARGFGYRDLRAKKPVTKNTAFPIASITKTFNATLLGMLVEQGLLGWDVPVQRYLPQFQLQDRAISPRVTVRDLLTMQTGLPRHDWVWINNPTTRAKLIECFAHLESSADFRQRFQYSNLSATAAGHIAEVITGKSWETLARERIFHPLRMGRTSCARPKYADVTLSYHENAQRKILVSRRLVSEVTAPSGGAVHSSVADMTRWILFNLNRGRLRRPLIGARTLAEIHAPQVIVGNRSLTGLPSDAAYGLGWVIDNYNGYKRIWHGGYLHDVNSSLMIFPGAGIGMISFINFGCPVLADLINQCIFDEMMGLKNVQTVGQKLTQYESRIADTRNRNASAARVLNTQPSHPLDAYLGTYQHPAYGFIRIRRRSRVLVLHRHNLGLRLSHWNYDTWVAEGDDMWTIHAPHAFDRTSQIQFYIDAKGDISRLSILFEPEAAPILFEKRE